MPSTCHAAARQLLLCSERCTRNSSVRSCREPCSCRWDHSANRVAPKCFPPDQRRSPAHTHNENECNCSSSTRTVTAHVTESEECNRTRHCGRRSLKRRAIPARRESTSTLRLRFRLRRRSRCSTPFCHRRRRIHRWQAKSHENVRRAAGLGSLFDHHPLLHTVFSFISLLRLVPSLHAAAINRSNAQQKPTPATTGTPRCNARTRCRISNASASPFFARSRSLWFNVSLYAVRGGRCRFGLAVATEQLVALSTGTTAALSPADTISILFPPLASSASASIRATASAEHSFAHSTVSAGRRRRSPMRNEYLAR
jgi:hypothetical protein